MSYREFIDSSGIVWKVWNTVPLAADVLTSDMKDGWLTFESMTCRVRRLTPVPENWEGLAVEQLEQLCTDASEVRRALHEDGVTMSTSEEDRATTAPER